MTLDEILALGARLGAASCGVVTAAELRMAGASQDDLRRALAVCWQRAVRAVYVIRRGELDDLTRGHVAVKHAGPGAVLTGLLAAKLSGMRWVPDTRVAHALVGPERRRRGSEGFVMVRRLRDVDDLAVRPFGGLLLAPPAQVIVDGAREIGVDVRDVRHGGRRGLLVEGMRSARDLRDVRGLVLGAVADGRCTAEEVRAVLDRGAVAGTALARRACHDAERGAVSPPEAELVDGLLACGVPFYCNVEVLVDGVLLGVADVWLLGTGVGGELDSKEFHADAVRLDATLARHRRFEQAGLTLVHRSPGRYRDDPAAFHEELFAAVRQRQAAGRAEPPGLELRPRGPLLLGTTRHLPPYRVAAA